jgi:ABC-2 type transport system ATP-binding protein
MRLLDEYTLEVDLDRDRGLNNLYQQLSQEGISVRSMRNKANRLEQLFVRLIGDYKNKEQVT